MFAAAMHVAEDSADKELDFEAVVRDQSRRLFGIAYSILHDDGEAQDAVQETFVKAWKSWATIEAPAGPWLTRVCVNTSLNRRHPISRWLLGFDPSVRQQAARVQPQMEGREVDLDRAYGRLSKQQRAVVSLHYHFGYALDECAGLMRCRPGTVRSHLARALATLRLELSHE